MRHKVLHLMLSAQWGGMEQVFIDYNEAMEGFCDVISVVRPKARVKRILPDPLKVADLDMSGSKLAAAMRFRRLVKRLKPDLIIAHRNDAVRLSKMALMGMKVPRICVRHGFFSSKASILLWRLQSDFTIGVNKKIIDALNSKNSALIYNIVSCNTIEKLQERKSLKRPVRIGFLGRVVRQKGAQFLIKALAVLNNKKNLNCQVIIGGNGRHLASLKALARAYCLDNQVKFLGHIEESTNAKEIFFQSIDIFCLPSLSEAFGLVLIESMARGVPVIASNIPGIDEVVMHNENGLLFEVQDHYDLADKIEYLITNHEKRNILASKALEDVKRLYRKERLKNDLYDVITKVLAKKPC